MSIHTPAHPSQPPAYISFAGWVDHSHQLSGHDKQIIKKEFSIFLSSGRWKDFERAIRHSLFVAHKIHSRIEKEAWNAYKFPSIGRFYTWLNDSRNISEEQRRAISRTVRRTLYSAQDSELSPDAISRLVRSELERCHFRHGWRDAVDASIATLKKHLPSSSAPVAASASSVQGQAMDKHALTTVFHQTQAASKRGYTSPTGARICIDPAAIAEMKKDTRVFNDCPAFRGARDRYDTEIDVVNLDSLNAAHRFASTGQRPLVLNLANARTPGGGVRSGSRAQEECLMRCSTYFLALFPECNPDLARQLPSGKRGPKYRIPETGAILTPRVTVFRDASKGYAFLERPFEVDMIASAAYDLKKGHWGGPRGSAGAEGKRSAARYDFEEGTKRKMRTQLTIAANGTYKNIVLGAFGCGAFMNDPEKIAQWYKELLDGEFRGVFEHVSFAVLSGEGAANHNFRTFARVFGSKSRPVAARAAESQAPQPADDHAAKASKTGERPSFVGDRKIGIEERGEEIDSLQSRLDRLLAASGDETQILHLIELISQRQQELTQAHDVFEPEAKKQKQ